MLQPYGLPSSRKLDPGLQRSQRRFNVNSLQKHDPSWASHTELTLPPGSHLQPEHLQIYTRTPDTVRIFISKMPISLPNPMFDYLLESSYRDNSNKWSNIGFGKEIIEVVSIIVNFMHLIWTSVNVSLSCKRA